MSDLLIELSHKALTLPPGEREQLAEDILASLQGDTDAEVDSAWDQEIRRRVDEVNSGTAKLIPAEDVFAEVRSIVG